jgi:uncharacterized membrane protein HdeD (DUF308 family)
MSPTVKEKPPDIDQQLRDINRAMGYPEKHGRSSVLSKALGILQMVLGVLAIIFSYTAGALFTVLLGGAIMLAGIAQLVSAGAARSVPGYLIGIAGIIAGGILVLNPVVSLLTLSIVIGAFLIASGIINLASANRKGTSTTGGIVEIILGGLVLASIFGIGLLVGIYLIVRGIVNYRAGQRASLPANR